MTTCANGNNVRVDELRASSGRRNTIHFLNRRARSCPSALTLKKPQISLSHLDEPIFERFHLLDTLEGRSESFKYFSIDDLIVYSPLCDDFGPMCLGSIFQFCNLVDQIFEEHPDVPIAMVTKTEARSLTNAVFLVGAYMLMKLGATVTYVEWKLAKFVERATTYRDVSPGEEQNFKLHIMDCWGGLCRAKNLGWVNFQCNGFDAVEYAHYDNPLNGDLHEIVPGKFIAFRGPQTLPDGARWHDTVADDGAFAQRKFSPAYYAEVLSQFNVQAVVRLNAPEYCREEFTSRGIGHVDLCFEDCTPPPADVVAKFMMVAEGLPGAVAVHCGGGLGRSGTLICLYMMAHHGFTAREALGWARIVRPGSVIGAQQQYLCDKEALMRRLGEQFRRAGPACQCRADSDDGPDVEAVERHIVAAVRTVDARLAKARGAGRPNLRRRHSLRGGARSPKAADAGGPEAEEAAEAAAAAADSSGSEPGRGWQAGDVPEIERPVMDAL